MRANIDPCGCFPTGRHYPGIAERLARTLEHVAGMAHGFAPDLVWAQAPLAVIDFETTGLDPELNRVIEIGIALFSGGKLERSQMWFVNPGVPIPAESTEITGITDDMVKDAPPFQDVWPLALPLLRGRIPVAYNYRFDSRFLWTELRRMGERTTGDDLAPACAEDGVWLDPSVWAREIQKEEKGFKLGDVCARLGVPLETAHRASHDAEAAGHALLALASQMPERYAEVVRVQRRTAATQDVELSWRGRR